MLDIPVLKMQRRKQQACQLELDCAIKLIDRKIKSRKPTWAGGEYGLKATCARAIQVYLQLVLNEMKGLLASEIAAESSNLEKANGA